MRRLGHVTKQRLTRLVYLVFLGLLSVPLSLMMGAAWRARGISFQLLRHPSAETELLKPREQIQFHTESDSGTAPSDWEIPGGL